MDPISNLVDRGAPDVEAEKKSLTRGAPDVEAEKTSSTHEFPSCTITAFGSRGNSFLITCLFPESKEQMESD